MKAHQHIPPQKEGRQTDFGEAVETKNSEEAHQLFLMARAKMLDITNWHNYCDGASSKFGLVDKAGNLLHGAAQIGDHFYIDLPATPGSDAGDGLEWVVIEKIAEKGDKNSEEEYIIMIVRPVPDPRKHEKETAHFYSNVSTSTFIVSRTGLTVHAEVHGRNEVPNNHDVDLHDTIRNTAIALSARIGLSGPQWKKLAKGLLE
ncbi:hypothetical protein [Mucilaginibacter boryungensis]|uniref:Uncharacterized protein n=1 Tax=Mucilaginibacter boryungensis TaxID=768480 RepID=A0ABR9XMT2_9SPHI|nr:hypothetical protein [Mucilaginibacter boryungensis]MBE9668520.1 hypothetical protein [Mucilaginibacter boryungensis]